MKRTLHPRPCSRFDNHIEQAGETVNSFCMVLILGSFFAFLLMYGSAPEHKAAIHTQVDVSRNLSETNYLLAIMTGASEGKKMPLPSPEWVNEADRQMAMATSPEDAAHLKGKARDQYFASLQGIK